MQSSSQGGGGGGMGGATAASLQEMQRLQQQLQAQYQQAQAQQQLQHQQQNNNASASLGAGGGGGGGGSSSTGGVMQFGSLAQQQAVQRAASGGTAGVVGAGSGMMRNTTALAMMQQHAGGNANPSVSNSSSVSSLYGNLAALQQQQQQQQQQHQSSTNMLTSAGNSLMDASSGSSARLMAMAGMGMTSNMNQHHHQMQSSSNDLNNNNNSTSSNMSISSSGNNNNNNNHMMMDSAAAMQSMQALFQQQQQAAAMGHASQQIPQQQQAAAAAQAAAAQMFAAAARRSSLGSSMGSLGGGGGGGSGGTASITGAPTSSSQLMGHGGAPQNMQQLMLQQQLSTLQQHMQASHQQQQHLQQQQHQQTLPGSGNNSVVGGSSSSAGVVQQQSGLVPSAAAVAAAMGLQGANAAAAASLMSASSSSSQGGSATNLLQARQQQLMQQIQQQQRAAAAAASASAPGGIMRQTSNPLAQLQQNAAAAAAAASIGGAGGGSRGPATAASLALQAQSVALGTALGRGQLNEQQLRLYQQNLLRSSADAASMGADAARAVARSSSIHSPAGSEHHSVVQQQQQQQQQHLRDVFGGNTQSEMDSSTSTRLTAQQLQQQHSANQHHSNRLTGTPSLMVDSSVRSLHSISAANPHHQQQQQHHQQQHHSSGPVTAMGVPLENSMTDGQQQQHAGQQAKNFLDGNFAGGWQSNDDLPDRRKVIFSILEVIRQMRPDASDMSSNRLPRMAKSLEEHLYRSAPTKEQYLDMKTLKRRLQSVASGLDIHRTSSGTSLDGAAAAAATNSHSVRSSSFGQQQQNAQWGNQNQPVTAAVAPSSSRHSSSGGVALNNSAPDMNGSHHGTISPSLSMLQQQHQQHQQSRRSILQSQQGGMIDSSALSQAPQLGSWNNNQGAVATQQIGSSQRVAAASSQQHQSDSSQDFMASQSSFLGSSSTASTAWDRTQSLLANALGGSSSSGTSSKVINPDYPNTPKYQDPEAAQKKKVIMQQQQRLLLLRHASKCKAGPTCSTKFCNQMVTLWRHMKTCRDKNCKTSHCLSSRCVLNHYRICKSQGKTATCEVCGPVMSIIRIQGRDDGSNDPLARDPQAPTPSSQPQMGDHSQMSSLARLMASQQQAAQAQLTSSAGGSDAQRQQHAVAMMAAAANQQMLGGNSTLGAMSNGVGSNGSVASLQDNSEQSQLQQLQQHQMKMQAQLESLKELQKQQQQLLDQQNRLQEQSELIVDPDSPSAQELQQQQMLLDELQKRCQQQQLRLQQEIEVQANSVSVSQGQQTQAQQTQTQLQQQQQQFQQAQLQAQQQAQQQFQQAQQQQAEAQDAAQPERVQAQDVAAVTSNSLATDEPSEPVKKKRSRSTSEGKPRRVGKGERSGKGKSLKISQARKAAAAEASVKRKSSVVAAAPKERVKKPKLPPQSEIPIPSAEDQNSSLVSFMTKENIESHLESLDKKIHMTNRTVTHKCLPIAQQLIDDKFGWVFHDAVDPVALGLPDYYEVIKTPMCLSLVKKKLENAIYPSMDLFARDVRLVFENAILYNGEVSEVGELAQSLLDKFAIMYKDLVEGVESSQQQLEIKGEACSLCGSQKRKFEPTVLYCQGKCGMQRIKRGATYYTERTKANHWCDACYDLIDPEDPIILDDGCEIQKKDLQEFKNDALPEEAWVNCDGCGSWVHQICALFNGRTNKSNAKYTCPHCYLRKGEEIGFPIAEKKFDKGAEDLPSSKMSTAIQSGVQEALGKAYALRAKELGVSLDEVEKADGLTVRVVSNVEKKQLIGEEMYGRYSGQGCPSELSVHSKCIGLFQKIHGADMLLFALYVYEYGQECPAPNKRRVYISYLDSVQYFEPKVYRTTAYQAILVEYLRYVKTRGFHTAHIWSCPPAPGDDYIFYCHPSHQLTPREDMLRTWYHEMLDKAKAQGIVIRSTTLYDEYFANDGVDKAPGPRDDPTCLPYFEGDYIPGEIETIIRHLRADNRKTDSTGDEVMNRLRHNIGKMKDNFIVVHLRNRRFAAAVERGEDVSKWTEDSDEELIRSKRAKISGKDSGSIAVDKEGDGSEDTKTAEPSASEGQTGAEPDAVKCNASAIAAAVSGHLASLGRKHAVVADTADEDPTIESEMFESRQQFLNYCQTNHCQFDELRRAKHSTMMVLFQLHNPSAPKFLQQCNACYRDMTHGHRYHCNNCSNFDLCEDCYKPVTTGLWAQRDERFAHDASHTFTPIDMEATEENQKSPAERQKALKDHISLLEHAGTCPGPPQCSLQNCERMKKLFEHVRCCEIKPKTGCKICTRLLSLCFMHARMCPIRGQCPIPFCDRIRERNLRVRRQQQLMDDRRRQAQNELYHAGGATSSAS